MKLLITGITGFIGSNLLHFMKENHPESEIDGYSRQASSILGANNVYNSLDIAFNRYNAVIHLAGKAHDLRKVENDQAYITSNYLLTKEIFDKFLASSADIFIFFSSVKASADAVSGMLTEEDIPVPRTIYGKSKQMAEDYILSRPLPENKKVYILRPAMVHGAGCKGNLNLLFSMVNRGIPYPLGAFENKRSYLSIGNLCFIVDNLLHENIPSGIYNMSDDGTLSTKSVVKMINQISNKTSAILYVPTFAIKCLATFGNWFKLPFNSENLEKLTDSYVVSNSKIKKALGKPLPLSIEQGMNITIQYLKENR